MRHLIVFTTLMGSLFSGVAGAQALAPRILMHESVPADYAAQLSKDLMTFTSSFLTSDRHVRSDGELQRLMGLSSLKPDAFMEWLEDRVQVIVGQSYPIEKNLLIATGTFSGESGFVLKPSDGTPRLVMENAGVGIYARSKELNVPLALYLGQSGILPISSPRSGVLRIGEGLFLRRNQSTSNESDAPINRLFRTLTLFHEARHSDGNGLNLGFYHVTCPTGHDYAGFPACDTTLNGPYSIQARFYENYVQDSSWNAADREWLDLMVLDNFSRILAIHPETGEASKEWDATPEGKR